MKKECLSPKCKNKFLPSPTCPKRYCSKKCGGLDYYYRNREKKIRYQAKYYKLNFEKIAERYKGAKPKEYRRKYYQRNKEYYKKKAKEQWLRRKIGGGK